jgi:hypothetical protein
MISVALCELRNSRDAPSEFEMVGLAPRDVRRIARAAIGGIANAERAAELKAERV